MNSLIISYNISIGATEGFCNWGPGRVGAAKGGYQNAVVELCNVCTETETETETDRELRTYGCVDVV
jgi:hypothetical protein